METARLSGGDRTYKPKALMVLVVAGCLWGAAASLWSGVASAQTPQKVYTRADYTDWLTKYANAKPDFKVGDVLTAKDIERMRPFVIPGYLDYLTNGGRIEVAQRMAVHSNAKTTDPYDRRNDDVSVGEVRELGFEID